MRVLRPPLPEPPDVVIPGLSTIDTALANDFLPPSTGPVLQGESVLGAMRGNAVPRAMIGWNPHFAQPSKIGPWAVQGGVVEMVDVGPAVPSSPIIDPTQKFLNSALPLDATGAWYPADVVLGGYAEVPMSWVLGGDSPISASRPLDNPRREITASGLLKTFAVATLPAEFGQKIYDSTQSHQVFTLAGTTTDGTGAPLGGCRVVAYQSGWQYVDNAPVIIAETVSDGSGAFSLLLRNIDYQLTAYKDGATDKAGLTRRDVTPRAAVTIYLRNPTAADSAGAGSGMSRSRVCNA